MGVSQINKQKVISEIEINQSNVRHNEYKEKNLGRGFWLAVALGVLGLGFNSLPELIKALHAAGLIGS